jgi:hypothetical protein
MGFMAGHITKGPLFYHLDRLSRNDASMSRLTALLSDLEQLAPAFRGLTPIFEQHILTDYDQALLPALSEHIRTNWFSEEQGWWQDQQPIEPVFCHGLIKTLREAIDNPISIEDSTTNERRQRTLPIDSYWIGNCDRFEITVSRSPQQITLLVMTPPPPTAWTGIWAEDAPIWVVRRDTSYEEDVEAQQTALEEVPEGQVESASVEWRRAATSRVITVRIRARPSSP